MANLNNEFYTFYANLQITPTRKKGLQVSHNNLREAIKRYFKENYPNDALPCFWIQGSYKMGTTIRNKSDECDLDDGVYFIPRPDVSAATLKDRVYAAVEGITDAKPINKNKCVRVTYAAGYHIDLPVYVKDNFDKNCAPFLAVRDDGFVKSDPREIVEWFKKKKENNAQLVRIISYFKAWADHMPHKMPPGLVWTTLAADDQVKMVDRDDIAFVRTAERIMKRLQNDFSCCVHGTPYDDVLKDYSTAERMRLLDYLKKLVEKGNEALEEKNKLKASKKWICLLGSRFPEAGDVDEDGLSVSDLRTISASVLSGSATIGRSGNIGTTAGVTTRPHKFYGS